MKIALIYEFLSEQGGLEREIINHANFLKKQGHKVLVLTCYKSKNIRKILPFENIPIIEISKIKTSFETLNLMFSFLGFNSLKNFNPDLFLSYSFPSNFLIRHKKNKKVNYINHYPHFLYLEGKEKLEWANTLSRKISVLLSFFLSLHLKKMDKKLVRENDLIFVNSYFTKRRIDSIYGIDSNVSYPPVDPKIKPSLLESKKEKFIFTCGRIIPDKKYESVIKSISFMKNPLPLYIAGQGKKQYIKKLINSAKKNNVKIAFLGKLNTKEISKYYSSAELFAFPTPKEDFGLVPAESLTCGTPCVVWGDGSGPTEQIIEGENGFLAKPYDVKDFANKMDRIIATNFKKKNRKKILKSSEKFSTKEIEKDFVSEIQKIKFLS